MLTYTVIYSYFYLVFLFIIIPIFPITQANNIIIIDFHFHYHTFFLNRYHNYHHSRWHYIRTHTRIPQYTQNELPTHWQVARSEWRENRAVIESLIPLLRSLPSAFECYLRRFRTSSRQFRARFEPEKYRGEIIPFLVYINSYIRIRGYGCTWIYGYIFVHVLLRVYIVTYMDTYSIGLQIYHDIQYRCIVFCSYIIDTNFYCRYSRNESGEYLSLVCCELHRWVRKCCVLPVSKQRLPKITAR